MIDQYPSANGVLTSLIWRKTMSGGETSLSGYDNASQALSYTPGQEQVYLNGILLVRGDDYTATNGTSITGLSALAASDFIQINCYNNFSVASVPAASLTGEVTNSQITSLATSKLTGTITNAQLAGSIANDKLTNSSITINGSAVALGGSATIAGGSAQDSAPSAPTEGQLWLDTDGTLATTEFVEKSVLTTTGDLLYASSANTPARIGIGSTSQVLTVSGGAPVWAAPAGDPGLTLIDEIAVSSSASTTVNDVFSSTYKNYKIMLVGASTGASASEVTMRLRVSGTDTTANYAAQEIYSFSTTLAGRSNLFGTDEWYMGDLGTSTTGGVVSFDLSSPNLADRTSYVCNAANGGSTLKITGGAQTDTTQFTGFTLNYAQTTTGAIFVYGYAKE